MVLHQIPAAIIIFVFLSARNVLCLYKSCTTLWIGIGIIILICQASEMALNSVSVIQHFNSLRLSDAYMHQ